MGLSILFVDDHDLIRVGLRRVLEAREDIAAITESGSGEDALEMMKSQRFDVVLLDLQLPGLSGYEVARFALERYPQQRILAFSAQLDVLDVRRLLALGVLGVVSKTNNGQTVAEALDVVLEGKRFLSADLAQKLALAGTEAELDPFKLLTEREWIICNGLIAGIRNQQIAARLDLSEKTVSTYRTRAFAKLGIGNIAELTRLGMRHGLDGTIWYEGPGR